MEQTRFQLPPLDDRCWQRLCRCLSLHPLTAQALCRRGYGDPEQAAEFLAGDKTYPATALAGIGEAVAVIRRHLAAGSPIAVHGDYDVDGVCATAILLELLRAAGGQVRYYLPDRLDDGYGLSQATVERLAAQGVRLLITVDCGASAVAEVERAKALGLEVVVSDHHALPPNPPAVPLLHPARGSYPFPALCGAAVAHKLAQVLAETNGALAALVEEQLELVALATVADVVPLVGENRALVRAGLARLRTSGRPGLLALFARCGIEPAKVAARDLAFAVVPRLNAAGRLFRADAALELLLCRDRFRAQEVVGELERANWLRKRYERQALRQAESQVRALGPQPAYVLAGEGWHPGVIGIVASRLVEHYRRPFALVALAGERGRGSARSVEGFDLVGALARVRHHLRRFGGHRAAAGFELARDSLQPFGSAFLECAAALLPPVPPPRQVTVDAVATIGELGAELAQELSLLGPFGRANPEVALLLRSVWSAEAQPLGGGRHLRFALTDGKDAIGGIAFGASAAAVRGELLDGLPLEGAFALELNEWRGAVEPRLRLLAAKPLPITTQAKLPYPVLNGYREHTATA